MRELQAGPGEKGISWLLLQSQRHGTKDCGPSRTVRQGRMLPWPGWPSIRLLLGKSGSNPPGPSFSGVP